MPWKEMIPASPDEKEEILTNIRKAVKRRSRYERKFTEADDELKALLVHAYPRVSTKALTDLTGYTRQWVWMLWDEQQESEATA